MDTAVELRSELNNDLNLKNDEVDAESKVDSENEPINKKLKLSDDVKSETQSSNNENNESSSIVNEESNPSSSRISESISSITKTEECKPSVSKIQESKPKSSENEESNKGRLEDAMPEIPKDGFIYPLEMDASDMLDEVEFEEFPSVTDRYLTPYYQLDVQKPGDDICVRIHSNRVCMISLAPSHIIFQENKTIVSCNYKVSDKLDRLHNKVSGKAKHGAQPLQSNSNLCCLTCSDGSSYMVKCCMIGKLIEVNEKLVENPELLKKEPHFGGYIALVLPNLKHLDKLKEKLLTQEQYQEAIKKRMEKKEEIEIKTVKEEVKVQAEELKEEVEEKDLQIVVTEDVKTQKKDLIDMETGETENQDYEKDINNDSLTVVKKGDPDIGITSMEVVES